jgi:hypothetical protein
MKPRISDFTPWPVVVSSCSSTPSLIHIYKHPAPASGTHPAPQLPTQPVDPIPALCCSEALPCSVIIVWSPGRIPNIMLVVGQPRKDAIPRVLSTPDETNKLKVSQTRRLPLFFSSFRGALNDPSASLAGWRRGFSMELPLHLE